MTSLVTASSRDSWIFKLNRKQTGNKVERSTLLPIVSGSTKSTVLNSTLLPVSTGLKKSSYRCLYSDGNGAAKWRLFLVVRHDDECVCVFNFTVKWLQNMILVCWPGLSPVVCGCLQRRGSGNNWWTMRRFHTSDVANIHLDPAACL